MTTEKIEVTDDWTAITGAGESGTCWLRKFPENGTIAIDHSEAGTGALDEEKSYYPKRSKTDIIDLSADSASDIFYAKCLDSGETAEIVSDVI